MRVFGEVRIPMHFSNFSKKMYGNFVHVFLLVYKEKLNVSYRRFVEIADENNLQRMLCIKRIPHFTTLQKFLQKIDKTVFEQMVRACRKLLNLKDIEASIDGTGFSNTNPSHYYQERVDGVKVKNYTKSVYATDNKTKLILDIKTHSDNAHETLDFVPLVSELVKSLKTVLADKAYDSRKNREYCWQNNIEVHIPLRDWPQNREGYGQKEHFYKPRKKALKLFKPETYKRRSLIESVNSAIKQTLGGFVRAKKATNQQKTVTIKAIAYNIEHINRTIKIWLYINCQGFLQGIFNQNLFILKKT
jgi:hypothetical protein